MKVADALNGQIRQRLPHPLNMHAVWERHEEFRPELPTVPTARPREGIPNPLTEDYDGTERHAQEMLLAYLRGTARFYVKRIKAELLESDAFRKAGLTSFHRQAAKDLRDARLRRKEYNLLHLAFRYRGKSNYRDAIFLAYGQGRLTDARSYVVDLATSARFVTFCALAYIQQRVGAAVFQRFSNDLQENFGGERVLLADLVR